MTITLTVLTSVSAAMTIALAIPKVVNEYRAFFSVIKKVSSRFSNKVTMVIDEFEGDKKNQLYEEVEIYLGSIVPTKSRKIKASKTEKEKEKNDSIKVTLEHNEKVKDVYDGCKFKWTWQEFKYFDHPTNKKSVHRSEVKSFKLKYKKKHRKFVIDTYLPYIIKEAKYLKRY